MLVVMEIWFCCWPFHQNVFLVCQPTVQLLGHWPYVFQHLCSIAVQWIFEIFFCFNHLPAYATSLGSYRGLPTAKKLPLQFDVLNSPLSSSQECQIYLNSFYLLFQNAEDAAASKELVSSANKFYISSKCFSSVQLKFWQRIASVGTCNWSSRCLLSW